MCGRVLSRSPCCMESAESMHGCNEGRIGVLGRHDWVDIGRSYLERERIFCSNVVEKRQEVLYPSKSQGSFMTLKLSRRSQELAELAA